MTITSPAPTGYPVPELPADHARAYAPSTLGSFLRSLKIWHVRHGRCCSQVLTGLNQQVDVVDAAAAVTYIDIDDTIRRTYGYVTRRRT